jgi:hypothetical protein
MRLSGIWYDLAGARSSGKFIVSEDGKHTICEPGELVDDLGTARWRGVPPTCVKPK